MPLAVVWFGSLGAVLISLTGIVDHSHNWDDSYDLWHLSRPLVGASLAIVSVLILQAGVLAIGFDTDSRGTGRLRRDSAEPALLPRSVSGWIPRGNFPRAAKATCRPHPHSCHATAGANGYGSAPSQRPRGGRRIGTHRRYRFRESHLRDVRDSTCVVQSGLGRANNCPAALGH
jgi:hypothetical protein